MSSPNTFPAASNAAPQRTPEVPPAFAPQAFPASSSTLPIPAPCPKAATAASLAKVTPFTIPLPWSPSPATESIRASSSSASMIAAFIFKNPSTATFAAALDASEPFSNFRTSSLAVTVRRAVPIDCTFPFLKDGVSAGASQYFSNSSSKKVMERATPAISRLVTSSPTSGDTMVYPFSVKCSDTVFHNTNNSSYFVEPRPSKITPMRRLLPSGASSKILSTRSLARSAAGSRSLSNTPGSPWIPCPTSILPSGTWNIGSFAPGMVHPFNPTLIVLVRSFAFSVSRTISSKLQPSADAAPATLNTVKVPTFPRRFSISEGGALAISSVI